MDGLDDTRRIGDDRLLSYALGLEPDAKLEAALAGDDELRARLEAVRADIGAIGQGLARVVPAPADEYTDLSGDRWDDLKPLLRAPAPPRRRRQGSWLRVLAPVAAVVLVLGFGAVALQYAGGGRESASTGVSDAAGEKASGDEAVPTLSGGSQGPTSAEETVGRAARQAAADYEIVVVARAGTIAGEKQAFDVVRALKGDAPEKLLLGVTGRAVAPDALVVLYLSPAAEVSGAAAPTPAPASTLGSAATLRWRQMPALALPLPPGTDPADVAL